MGVPKFFRYTSERYPCLNELVKPYQIPDFDNMYLDMNGIIHNCSHPDDSNPHFRITEEKIFEDIFHYLSILFQIIKPKKLFFMAIDGVAPRAKMNQQRGRRFRSAREAEVLEEQAKAKGEVLPTEKRFDSNCITPGTVFMTRLHEQLRYFVRRKISTDPLWAKVKVILSGHETPGEGEHKIMDYIRWARSRPDYDAATRHCLYGLDADLIMLGLCTHELHFALLREEVKFGKTTQRATCPEETNFYLLHLSLLRQYLEQEFIGIKDSLPFEYDLEKIVDDWVLMGFLVGNDFIPNLPNMHISNDALPLLYAAYMKVLPTLDGYINESGDLHLGRFETFMQELAKIDKEKFHDTYADLKYFEAKTGRRPNAKERKEYKPNNDDTFNVNLDDIRANKPDDELQALINATQDMFMDDVDGEVDYDELDTSDEESNFNMEFKLHKKDYYMNKLDYSKVTDLVLVSQAAGYARAIQWNLYYYYRGCPSWSWYYPHHYAPYMSDIKGIADLKIEFELGEPFKPFEQLLAVLPAASKGLLPSPFHELMTDENSPIIHYYPVNFETDLNGKKNDWEAVVLIPFIDEANLLTAMMPCYQRLTDEERNRNTHGPMLVYTWTQQSLGTIPAPQYFPPVRDCRAVETRVRREDLLVPPGELRSGLLPSVDRNLVFPGFPTMKHLKYKTELKKCKVKVFDQPSRNENMIVQLLPGPEPEPALDAAAALLGTTVHVGWPHLTAARVTSVSSERQRLHYVSGGAALGPLRYTAEANAGNLHKQWLSERSTVIEHNMNRLGIELGDVNILVHACNLKGHKYIVQDDVSMTLEPVWCSAPCGYARQAVVTDLREHVASVATRLSTPAEAYPAGEQVFLVTPGAYYGCLATVVDSTAVRSGRIKVSMSAGAEPAPSARAAAPPYRPANQASQYCGVSPSLLSRVTGSVLVAAGARRDALTEQLDKLNLGLNLKFNKKNQEVSGYTRRCPASGAWLYSRRCGELVAAYAQQFPEVFDALANKNCDVFFEGDLWPNDVGAKKPQEVLAWLKTQPHAKAARRECGSEALEPEELRALADSLDRQLEAARGEEKKVTLHVKWSLLYKADLHSGNISPDPKADFMIYDRVVCVAANMTVPMGAKGTITAVYSNSNTNTVRLHDKLNVEPTYQVLFDESFPGAMKEELFDTPRFYRMQPSCLLNLSFGRGLRGRCAPDTPSGAPATPPTVLRRGPAGSGSAFASYSPTKDRQTPESSNRHTPVVEPRNATPRAAAAPAAAPGQDTTSNNGTELLKSLLKISQDSPDTPKHSKKPKQPQDANWRSRADAKPSPVPPPAQKPPAPALNWRQESAAPRPPQEWSPNASRGYSGQPPIPPFPNFNQPFQQPNPQQYQNPHFQRNQNNQLPFNQSFPPFGQGPPGVQNGGQAPAVGQPFPQHLPNVAANVTLAPPGWAKQQSGPKPVTTPAAPAPALDKLINPFVPLQVQAKRRVHNPSGPANFGREPPPPAAAPPPPPAVAQTADDAPPASRARTQKKKKRRIAANLPFQTD